MKPVALETLAPMDSEITINGKRYELNKFSLYHQVWANEKYQVLDDEGNVVKRGVDVLTEKLGESDIKVILELIHSLLKDQSDFETPKELGLALDVNDLNGMLKCMFEVLGSSQPILSEYPKAQRKKKKKRAS